MAYHSVDNRNCLPIIFPSRLIPNETKNPFSSAWTEKEILYRRKNISVGKVPGLKAFRLTVCLEKAFYFFLSNRHDSTVARMKIHADGMVYYLEIVQVGTFRKLVFSFHINIIHQDVLIRP